MSRFEHEIFETEGSVQDVIDYRSQFGWVYVKQVPRSRTVSSRSKGGGYSVGAGGFFTSHKTVYNTIQWTEVEMRRDRADPNYAVLVECERTFENEEPGHVASLDEPPGVLAVAGICAILAVVAGFVVAFVGSLIPAFDDWFQARTSGMSMGFFLVAAAFVCIGIGMLMALAYWPFAARARNHYEARLREYRAHSDAVQRRRQEALERARTLTGHQTPVQPQGS